MSTLLKKLQFKNNDSILVLEAPDEFGAFLKEMEAAATVITDPSRIGGADFILVFSRSAEDIARQIPLVAEKY